MSAGAWTSHALLELLRKKHSGDAWAFFAEVPERAGFSPRRIDALAMSLWPSRGLELHGFEIKISRADWLRELRQAEKADGFWKRCDRFFLVAPSGVVAEDGELPPTWGLLQPAGGGLSYRKPAPKLEAAPLDRAFLAGLCRQIHRASPAEHALDHVRREAHKQGREDGIDSAKFSIRTAEQELLRLRSKVTEFETAAGIVIDGYNPTNIGERFKRVQALEDAKVEHDLQTLHAQLSRACSAIKALLG